MRRLLLTGAITVGLGLVALAALIALAVERNRIYDVEGISRIEKDFRVEIAAIDKVDSGGVGAGGDTLGFGQLVNRIHGQYPLEEVVKIAKSPDPIKSMIGLELLAYDGRYDFLVRHLADRRPIEFLSGCTIHSVAPIGEILARYYEVEDYANRHRLQLGAFKVVLVNWG